MNIVHVKKTRPYIITSDLVLNLDAGKSTSYSGSGTTWYDISVNSNNGTLTNGPTYNSSNRGSIVFDGNNDVVSIPSFNEDSNQALSVFCWFNSSDLSNKNFNRTFYSWLVNKRDNSSDRQWQLIIRETASGSGIHRLRMNMWDTTTPTQNILDVEYDSENLSENTWYYGGFVTDGANVTMYLDGASGGTGTLGGTGVRKTGSREIVIAAAGWDYNTLPLKGKISSVQIYDRALSATEVQRNFIALRGRYEL